MGILARLFFYDYKRGYAEDSYLICCGGDECVTHAPITEQENLLSNISIWDITHRLWSDHKNHMGEDAYLGSIPTACLLRQLGHVF
jgi:hypothetical protein